MKIEIDIRDRGAAVVIEKLRNLSDESDISIKTIECTDMEWTSLMFTVANIDRALALRGLMSNAGEFLGIPIKRQ